LICLWIKYFIRVTNKNQMRLIERTGNDPVMIRQ
jgi:hypothetical protein